MRDDPVRLLPYAILLPGPIAAVLIVAFPGWPPLITTIAAVTIVALTLRLVAVKREHR